MTTPRIVTLVEWQDEWQRLLVKEKEMTRARDALWLCGGALANHRNTALFRWCLEQGLRVGQVMTLMSTGLYNEPAGACLPSILY